VYALQLDDVNDHHVYNQRDHHASPSYAHMIFHAYVYDLCGGHGDVYGGHGSCVHCVNPPFYAYGPNHN
tara:strand:+ start:1217 stop:1423 length:207 start_codon:yes stop_codon:yes gene_type:complete